MNTTTVKKPWKIIKRVILGLVIGFFGLMAIAVNSKDKEPVIPPPPADPAIARKALIEKAFNSWDGSHRNLVKLVKQSMNDESSFEAIDTKYYDHDSLITVIMQYSGKNAYNATVKAIVSADCALDGTVLKIRQ